MECHWWVLNVAQFFQKKIELFLLKIPISKIDLQTSECDGWSSGFQSSMQGAKPDGWIKRSPQGTMEKNAEELHLNLKKTYGIYIYL